MFADSCVRAMRCALPTLLSVGVFALPSDAPRAQSDPATLDAAVASVREMRERGASVDEIAAHVSGLVDRRMVNANSWEGVMHREWPPLGYYYNSSAWRQHDRFGNERESQVATGALRGIEYATRAQWTWNIQYGQCGEASALTYYLLRQAGVSARMVEVPGHAFTVIGADANADMTNPATWGSGARVVDGWLGRSLDTNQMRNNRWFRGRPTDVTGAFDNPELHAREIANQGRANLVVTVEGPSGGVPGVAVEAVGPEQRVVFSGTAGRTDFPSMLEGEYTLRARPPVASGYEEARSAVTVRRPRQGWPVELAVTLARTEVQPVDLIVRVVDGEGAPVGGATITSAVGAGTTDGEGRLALRSMPGEVAVSATKTGVGGGATSVRVEPFFASYANIVLRPAEVRIAITAPMSGAVVEETRVGVTGVVEGGDVGQVVLEVDGIRAEVGVVDGAFAYGFDLEPGPHTLTASAPSAPSVSTTFTVSPGGAPPPLEGLRDPWVGRYHLRGRATCSMDGADAPPHEIDTVVTTRRQGDRGIVIELLVQGRASRQELTLTPSNPSAATGNRTEQASPVPGGHATTTTHVAAFVREGRLYYTERLETAGEGQLTPDGPVVRSSMTCNTMLMGEPVQ